MTRKPEIIDKKTRPSPIEDLIPKDNLQRMAWVGCLRFSIKQKEILDAFMKDTGIRYSPPKSVIDEMIDDASGHSADVIRKFVLWFNENIWGDWDATIEE